MSQNDIGFGYENSMAFCLLQSIDGFFRVPIICA